MADTFKYSGYNFTPYRKFRKGEGGFMDINRRFRSDRDLGLWTYGDRKADYTYDGFYAASPDKICDIFRCEENGRLYVPCTNELFEYQEPRQRSRPSAVAKLDKAKEAAAASPPAAKPDKSHGNESR
jgi:hypothetical protein